MKLNVAYMTIGNNKTLFSICTRIESDIHLNLLKKCISSIQKYHINSDIVVIDSCSPFDYTSYAESVENVTFKFISNTAYELGALIHTYLNYKYEYYVFMQDSMELLGNMDDYIKDYPCFVNTLPGNHSFDTKTRDECYRIIGDTDYEALLDFEFYLVQFNTMSVSRHILNTVIKKGIGRSLPHNKDGSQATERLWGMVFKQEGYNISDSKHIIPSTLIKKIWAKRT